MKRFAILILPVVLPLSAAASDPAGFAIWTARDLGTHAAQLRPKMGNNKVASETLADYGHYKTMLTYREASGAAELHEKMADLFVIEEGDATLVVGGEIVDRTTAGPGEVRGTAIAGGERHHLATGDTLHIPAGVPHQLLVDAGHTITYFVVKVESQ